jgi:hypothetical protein
MCTTAGKVPRSAEMSAAATRMTARSVAAAHGVATTTAVTAASTTATAMLRQCRPGARQDQCQRTRRKNRALALDTHIALLTMETSLQGLTNKTLSVQRGSPHLVYTTGHNIGLITHRCIKH